jgi:hypothetical protein
LALLLLAAVAILGYLSLLGASDVHVSGGLAGKDNPLLRDNIIWNQIRGLRQSCPWLPEPTVTQVERVDVFDALRNALFNILRQRVEPSPGPSRSDCWGIQGPLWPLHRSLGRFWSRYSRSSPEPPLRYRVFACGSPHVVLPALSTMYARIRSALAHSWLDRPRSRSTRCRI